MRPRRVSIVLTPRSVLPISSAISSTVISEISPSSVNGSTVLADLDGQWNGSNVTEPSFIEVNGANEP